jgi:hypothetical protein
MTGPHPARSDEVLDREPDELVRCLACWPYLRVEAAADRVTFRSVVGDAVVATLDRLTSALTVGVSPALVPSLLAAHPQLQATDRGVRVAITDAAGRRAAEALIGWLLDVVRFAPQLRDASP